jgi:hypothetical protein
VNVGQTLLYGSQMWGHSRLRSTHPMKHDMQPIYSVIPRQTLRQHARTAHWIVCMQMGLMPIQYWIMRSFVRWWNKLLSIRGQNSVIDNCLTAQIDMLNGRKICWLKRWDASFRRVLPQYPVSDSLRNGQPIDEPACMLALRASYHNMLKGMGNPRDPDCTHRRIAVAYSMHAHELGFLPVYHAWQMSKSVRTAYTSFLCTNTDLPVHSLQDRAAYADRVCSECAQIAVADEHHVLLDCISTQPTRNLHSAHGLNFQVDNLRDFFGKNNCVAVANYVTAALAAYRS